MLVVAGRVGDGELKVAAAGAVEVVLAATGAVETRVSHGVHWYCREGHSFGFAPNGDIDLRYFDSSHGDDPRRLSWRINREGGYRAGVASGLENSDKWRKHVWGFSL